MSTATTERPENQIDRQRYRRVILFALGVIMHIGWWDIFIGRIPLARRWTRRSRPERLRRLSSRFRNLAVEMGGVMIKLGQFLSSRVDVLPPEVTESLKDLQDEAPPVPLEAIQTILAEELDDLPARFAHIETEPQAAASLGQTHRAWLRLPAGAEGRGPAVVIKVQRPNIENIVRTDLAALQRVARWVTRYGPIRRRADVPALMEEFSRTLWEELDYEAEAGNAERFAAMFKRDPSVRIPNVYHQHSTRRVLVLENVEGIKIADVAGMRQAGIDPGQVADRLFDIYFKQIFREGFFHADPHPGNLFVEARPFPAEAEERGPQPFRINLVDFGMVGRVPNLMGKNLRRILIGVAQRDARALTQAHNELGFFLPGADLERITEAQERLLDQIWGRSLLELSRPDPQEIQKLSREFRDILFDFPFQVPQDFILLGRAIGMLSGLVSTLNPEINPWQKLERYGRELLSEQERLQISWDVVSEWIKLVLVLPTQLQRVLTEAEAGELTLKMTPDEATARRLSNLERRVGRLKWSILSAAALVAGTLFYIAGLVQLAVVVWLLAGLFFLISH